MKVAYEELCASANATPCSITHCSFAGKCCTIGELCRDLDLTDTVVRNWVIRQGYRSIWTALTEPFSYNDHPTRHDS